MLTKIEICARPGMCPDDADTTTIVDKISSPLIASLLSIHPNDVTLRGRELPSQWSSWWAWASEHALVHPERAPAWLQLVHYFMRPCGDDGPNVDVSDAFHRRYFFCFHNSTC